MTELYDLDPLEVSLVDEGANKRRFLIFKSREKKMPQPQEIRNLMNSVDPKIMGKIEKVLKSMHPLQKESEPGSDLLPKADSHVYKEDENAPLSERAQAALKAVARILAPFKDELHDGHLDAVQNEIGMKDSPQGEEMGDDDGEIEKVHGAIPQDVEEEHHIAALGKAKEAYKSHMMKLGGRKYPDENAEMKRKEDHKKEAMEKAKAAYGEQCEKMKKEKNPKEDKVDKSAVNKSAIDLTAFPEKQRETLELVFKANETLEKTNKELVQKAAKLEKDMADRDSREKHREYVAKAAEFKHVGLSQDEIVETLKDAASVSEKSYERVCKQFTAMNEQASKGNLFGEIGSRAPAGAGGDAEAKLERLVDSFVAKSDSKTSRAEIYEQVLQSQEGQRLYKEMKNARPGGI